MRKFLLFGFLCLLQAGLVQAQERTVTGKVTAAEDGSPLPGVNVVVKGTASGTVTDIAGEYKVNVPAGELHWYSLSSVLCRRRLPWVSVR